MKPKTLLSYSIRKWYSFTEDTFMNESGAQDGGQPVRKVVIAAAIHNPYAGTFEQDLSQITDDSAALGEEFGKRLNTALEGQPAQSYGKSCIVGSLGEYEHGNAFLTTAFANPIRDALGGGKSWIPSSGKRGDMGTAIDIPLACKDALYVRSHYDTITMTFPDGPAPDEVVVIFAVATRGRIHARLGGLAFEDVEGEDGLK